MAVTFSDLPSPWNWVIFAKYKLDEVVKFNRLSGDNEGQRSPSSKH